MIHQNARKSSRMPAADLIEAHRTYHEETLFDAVVVAGVVVALADGQADTAERLELARFVEQSRIYRHSRRVTQTTPSTAECVSSRWKVASIMQQSKPFAGWTLILPSVMVVGAAEGVAIRRWPCAVFGGAPGDPIYPFDRRAILGRRYAVS
jgi:hypothetical protein